LSGKYFRLITRADVCTLPPVIAHLDWKYEHRPFLKILRFPRITRAPDAGKQHLGALHRHQARVVQVRQQWLLVGAAVVDADLDRRADAVDDNDALDRRQAGDLLVGKAGAALAQGLTWLS